MSTRLRLLHISFPECPPAAVEIGDEDDPISGVTSGFDVTASIVCDAASVLPREHVQEMFQDVFNQGGQSSVLGAAATSSETDAQAKKPKPNKNKHKLPGSNLLFEFACDKNSSL